MTASQFHLSYSSTKNVLDWAKPGVIFVPDQHRDDPVYKQAQAQGAEVSPYLNVCEDHVRGAKDREYREFLGAIDRWGNERASWYPLMNMEVGSEHVRRSVEYIVTRIMPFFDGITLDVVGGQLHAKANWKNWPEAESAEWRAGNVDFVRLLDIERRRIKPWFKIQTVNIWHEEKEGLKYVDGFFVESPAVGVGLFYRNLVNMPCGYLGQRRVLVIADNEAEAKAYAELPGVTHVTVVDRTLGHTYLTATPPVVDPVDNRLAEAQAMREWLHQNAGGEIAVERDALRAERNAALAVVEDLEQQIQILHERALSATNSLDTSVAAIRGAIEQLRGGTP